MSGTPRYMFEANRNSLDIDAQIDGEIAQLKMRGDLDNASAPRLISTIHDHVRPPVRRIDLDCDGVEMLDSAGVRALIVGRNEACRAGIDFGLVDQSQAVSRVLERVGLSALLTRVAS